MGPDSDALAAAARYAMEHETPWKRDLSAVVAKDFEEHPPWNETLGSVRPRGGPNGLVLRAGQIVAGGPWSGWALLEDARKPRPG